MQKWQYMLSKRIGLQIYFVEGYNTTFNPLLLKIFLRPWDFWDHGSFLSKGCDKKQLMDWYDTPFDMPVEEKWMVALCMDISSPTCNFLSELWTQFPKFSQTKSGVHC